MFSKKNRIVMIEEIKAPLKTLGSVELQKLYESKNLSELILDEYDLDKRTKHVLRVCKIIESLGGDPFIIPDNQYLYSIPGDWAGKSILMGRRLNIRMNYGFPLPYKVYCFIERITDTITPDVNDGCASLFVLSPSPYLGTSPDEEQANRIQQADPSLVVILRNNGKVFSYRFDTWDLTLDGLNILNIH